MLVFKIFSQKLVDIILKLKAIHHKSYTFVLLLGYFVE